MRHVFRVFVEAPDLHQRPNRNIESALAAAAVIQAAVQQAVQFRRDRHRRLVGTLVHPAPLALRTIIRKQLLEPLGLVEGVVDGGVQPELIVGLDG